MELLPRVERVSVAILARILAEPSEESLEGLRMGIASPAVVLMVGWRIWLLVADWHRCLVSPV
jgi:hypothetical protein